MTGGFVIQALRADHERSGFSCGAAALDRYFREQVTQDVRRRVTGCYVAVEPEISRVAGYYTLAASGVPLADLSPDMARKLPRYPLVPVGLLGRLAIDRAYQGRKLGAALLWDAAARAARSELMAFALVVAAKDASAEAFYQRHEFVACGNVPGQFMFPLSRLKAQL